MKKRFSVLLILGLALSLLLTGCGPNTQAYMDIVEGFSNWEAIESNYTGKIRFVAYDMEAEEEIKFEIPIEADMYILGQDKGVVDYSYDFSGIKALAPTEEEAAMFPDEISFRMFIDGNKAIMPKEMFTMGMEEVQLDILEGDEEYIALDMSEFGLGEGEDFASQYAELGQGIMDLFQEVYGQYTSDFDMERDGDKFSYNFDTENGKAELLSFLSYTKEHRDILVKGLEPILEDLIPEETANILISLEEGLETMDMEGLETQIDQVFELLSGSKISGSVEFEEDSLTQEIEMVLAIAGAFKMEISLSGYEKEAEVREIEIPTDVKTIKYSEYMEYIFSSMEIVTEEANTGEKPVLIIFDDMPLEFDTPAIIEDGTTLVPFRGFLEMLDAEVEWDEATRVVTSTKGEDVILLTIGSDIAVVNGVEVEMDKAAKTVEGRTLVPLRFISENFGYEVAFENTSIAYFISVTSE